MSFEFLPSSVFPATPLAVSLGGTGGDSASAARTNLGLVIGTNVQAFNAALLSIAGLTTAADKMIYTTASNVYAVADLTAAGRALLDDASATAQRATLSVAALEHSIPTEAGTVSAAATTVYLILEPAGALTDLTVNFPTSPTDGQMFRVAAAAFGITNLTLGAGAGTISGAITTLAANAFAAYVYRTANTTWYRCG